MPQDTQKPKWNTEMSADALDNLEREEFLNWRRSLALLEEKDGIVLTPFERNLEFWRQLWRVVERSDIVVQVVDARQPLLYYCEDLETYIHEVDPSKTSVVLVNKSDFLTGQQRFAWAQYFKTSGINAIFWSAALASEQILERNCTGAPNLSCESEKISDENCQNSFGNSVEDSAESDADSDASTVTLSGEIKKQNVGAIDYSSQPSTKLDCNECNVFSSVTDAEAFTQPIPEVVSSSTDSDANVEACAKTHDEVNSDILGVEELLDLLTRKFSPPSDQSRHALTIGFIGYPNVGKSSTLNAILGHKKVSVSVTPGKTKHFQTIYVRSDLMLCDCPGLVMPSFAYSKADLIVAGILSIDEMRDYLAPIGLVCERIPRDILEIMYGINLPKSQNLQLEDGSSCTLTPHELLAAHAFMHGFMTAKGNPNYDRSARIILKDFVKGKLLYCHPPPNVTDPVAFQSLGRDDGLPCGVGHFPDQSKAERFIKRLREKNKRESIKCVDEIVTEFDRLAFKRDQCPREHTKSNKRIPILRSQIDKPTLDDDDVSSTASWSTVGSVETVSNFSCLSSGTAPVIFEDGTVKKPWRLLSHSKHLSSGHNIPISNQNGTVKNFPRPKKRKEKLRRVYRHLDEHEKT
ncbi:unnamed protein product [Heterobilharzia americana]|nr:unnamed protein product [Heterobilharzia americana]CAH8473878.1 unnamed protein product [Heterobilharzia americana]